MRSIDGPEHDKFLAPNDFWAAFRREILSIWIMDFAWFLFCRVSRDQLMGGQNKSNSWLRIILSCLHNREMINTNDFCSLSRVETNLWVRTCRVPGPEWYLSCLQKRENINWKDGYGIISVLYSIQSWDQLMGQNVSSSWIRIISELSWQEKNDQFEFCSIHYQELRPINGPQMISELPWQERNLIWVPGPEWWDV